MKAECIEGLDSIDPDRASGRLGKKSESPVYVGPGVLIEDGVCAYVFSIIQEQGPVCMCSP